MKKLVVFVAALLQIVAVAQVRYSNPIMHVDYSDPDVCRVGDDYYMTASSFNYFPGLPILHSKDLVNWELVGAALTDYTYQFKPQSVARVQHGNGVWAPAIRYHDGWFYIYCGDPDRGIFMVKTQDPFGEWEAPVWVYRGRGFIDPSPLWDDDGKAYLSHAAAGSRAGLKSVVFVAPMSPDGTKLLGPSRMVFDGHATQPTIEGTKMYKRDGKYYIFCPAGGVRTGWQTVLRADDPFGPYEEKVVMAPAEGTINGPHQGAWVDTPQGSDWFIHFQDKGAYGRIVHLQPMEWRENGWPVIGHDADGDGCGQPVDSWTAPFGVTNIPYNEWDRRRNSSAYKPYGLDLEWQYPSVPSPYWHYAIPEGGVRLFSAESKGGSNNLWDIRNLLTQKFPEERFKVFAKLGFGPHMGLGENAGMVAMGSSYAGFRLADDTGSARLQYIVCNDAENGGEEKVEELLTLPYESGIATVWVMMQVYPRIAEKEVVARFSYSLDGKEYIKMPDGFVCQPGKWVGSRFGFWCNRSKPKNDGGHLDITEFRITRELGDHKTYQYDESKVPDYQLPDALMTKNGRPVRTVKEWEKKLRPELLELFASEIYGKAPVGRPSELHFNLLESGEAFGGKAIRKQVRIWFDAAETQGLTLLLYTPEAASGPVPVFLGANFQGNVSVTTDKSVVTACTVRGSFLSGPVRGAKAYRWPIEYAIDHGYGVATFCYEDVDPDFDDGFKNGVIGHYGPEERKGDSWGNIAAWAWGLSRALDYLETDPDVASDKVAVLGHSRLGKTALWAGATDPRFAMVISNASGCGGAAISRRHYGETLRRIGGSFPHWWCPNFYKYADNEDLLPVDQHELLALIAPRPLYIESCSEDLWADPYGEYLSLVEASKVYKLYGLEGFTSTKMPEVENPEVHGPLGHHIRAGKHDIILYDWQQYIRFADSFLK